MALPRLQVQRAMMLSVSKRLVAEIAQGLAIPLLGGEPRPIEGGQEGAIVVTEEGRVLEEFAPPRSAKARLYRLAADKGLDPVFPAEVRAEVAAWQTDPKIADPILDDCTSLPFVTIDGSTSRDLDQAVYVRPEGEGHVVYYALADAAFYVRPGTALFEEALRRGASYYLPGVMIPMLPEELSEGLVSLNPGVDRRSMLFEMHCDAVGRCTKTTVRRARVRSRAKLDWDGVQAFYDGGAGFGEAIDRSLEALRAVGERRMKLAESRGVVRYRRTEVEVGLDGDEGMRFVILDDARRDVERYNEQVSLLCNVEGAKTLALGDDPNVEAIYRVHPPPDDERLEAFERMLRALSELHHLDPTVWVWSRDDQRTLANYLDQLPREGKAGRLARAIHRQAVMVNLRSSFQTKPAGHYGVGAEVYARFSAPMREIVGVYLHLQLWEQLEGCGRQDEALRQAVVTKANEVRQVQRALMNEANRLVLDQLFERRRSFDGTIMGLTHSKIHVTLDAPPIDVKLYVRHQRRLAKGDLELADEGAAMVAGGELFCRLGDAVKVHVQGRDHEHDRWILTLERVSEE